jgi:recombination protein RecT
MNQEVAVRRDFSATIRDPKFQEQIKATLPESVSISRFTATTITAINHNPALLEADRQSLYNAIVKAAQDGLLPDGTDGVLNIYNTKINDREWIKKVQWQKMVGGIIKLFGKAGIPVYAVSVYEKDKIEIWNDDAGQHVKHVPVVFGDRGERIGAFACATLPSGRTIIEAMNQEELARARDKSKNPEKGPWLDWPERMEQKTVLHRLSKRVAVTDEKAAESLRSLGDEFDEDEPAAPKAAPEPPPAEKKRPRALQAVVDAAPAAKPVTPPVQPTLAPQGSDDDVF